MGNTPRLDKFLFAGGLAVFAVAGAGVLLSFNAPCIDVGCIVAGIAAYIAGGVAAVGAVLALIGGIRIKLRKSKAAA